MKLKITVPESLSEITLGQYQKYLKIQEQNEDGHFLQSKLIEILCDIPLDVVLKMKLSDTNAISEMLIDLLSEEPQLVKHFDLNGKKYGFIPNLDEISLGEYIDLDTFLGDWDNIHKAMNVLYRPIKGKYGERYSIEKYNPSDALHLKDMPMDCVVSSMLFFYRLGIDLSTTILNSLQESQENNLVQYLNSQKNGVGINQYTHSLKATLRELKISLN